MQRAPSLSTFKKPLFRPIAGFFSVANEANSGDAPQSRLGPPMNASMATPASIQYRVGYQRHRAGGATGSVGEAPQDDKASNDSMSSALLLEALGEVDDKGTSGDVWAPGSHDREKGYHELLKWRLAYQAHRSGASRGAKGEIGTGLSVADVRMLPVAQLAAHERQLAATRARASSPTRNEAEGLAEQPRPTHVHVGAGRLGLGLVLPALARSSKASAGRLVLLQRASDAWAALAEGSEVRFTLNTHQLVCRLRVVRSASQEVIDGWKQTPPDAGLDGLLVLSEEEPLLDELARTATSLSCSLGPALGSGLAPLLSALVRVDVRADAGRLRLYAAENDHAAVQKLTETPQLLGGLDGLPLEVIPLLVDRVCTARTISAGQVDTAAEPWAGEIVVMAADDHNKAAAKTDEPPSPSPPSPKALLERRRLLAAPPFSGDGVRWPKSEAEAHLLHRRKILTVNGTHTTLAFHTLAVHEPPPHAGLPKGDYELIRAIAADDGAADDDDDAAVDAALQVDDAHAMAWAWVVARQLLLLFESDVVVARAAFGCERESGVEADAALAEALLEGARVALDRLGRGGDTTKRVLGGGVVSRFNGRLKPIACFLDASGASGSSRWLRGALPRQVLRRAKLTETAMRLAVLGLTADAERFTLDAS